MIEMDKGLFHGGSFTQHSTQKAGRCSNTKSNVRVHAESTILEDIDT